MGTNESLQPSRGGQIKTRTLKKFFLEKMRSTLGNVTRSCEEIGISRQAYYAWLKADSKFAAAVNEIVESSIDFAESCLFQQMREGNTTAIIFYLKTRGKDRGYIESKRIEASGDFNMELPKIDLELVGGDDE